MIITIQVDLPLWMAQGIKEAVAMDLEKYGDVKVIAVDAPELEQLQIPLKKEGT